MAKRTGKGSGKPAPAVVVSGADYTPEKQRTVVRPKEITAELFEHICLRLEDGASLLKLNDIDGMPSFGMFYRYMENNQSATERYARARQTQADFLAIETMKIADEEPDPSTARNRIDARRWYAAKVAPKKYGDRIEVDHNVNTGFASKVEKARKRAAKQKR